METPLSITTVSCVSLVLLVITLFMFNDALRGSVDMASSRMRYLYNKASTNLGLSSFSDDELSDTEKARNIRKFRNTHVGGLYNEGNTCFMNSVIQALASCGPIEDYVEGFRNDMNFSGGLGDVIKNLNQIHTRQHGYSTLNLVRLIGGGAQRWSRYNQEDAQEFFQELLTTLEKNVKDKQSEDNREKLSGNEADAAQVANVTSAAKPEPAIRMTPFDGSFAVRVGCLTCGDMEGIRTGVLSSVDVSLELTMSRVSLDQLLKNYTAMENISGVECYRCSLNMYRDELAKKVNEAEEKGNTVLLSAFKKRVTEVDSVLRSKVIDDTVYKNLKGPSYKIESNKTKQTMFAKPYPDVLMIHINRSVFDLRMGIVRKNSAAVDFPVVLDLSAYTVDPKDPTNNDPRYSMKGVRSSESDLYDLKAAVFHYGSANFGHYISFRKFHGFWWRISDDQVDLTTEAQVLNSQGVFMLFYEKRGASSRPEFPTVDLQLRNSSEFSDSGEPQTCETEGAEERFEKCANDNENEDENVSEFERNGEYEESDLAPAF